MPFEIRNMDSLDTRDAKMPPELVKAFYELGIKSVLDIGCGSGWLCDYMPVGTRYLGFDSNETAIANAQKLHPEGDFICTTIEALVSDVEAGLSYTRKVKFDCAFLKCIICTVTPDPVQTIIKIVRKMVSKYVFLYETEKTPGHWSKLFEQAGFKLVFSHRRGGQAQNSPKKATHYVNPNASHVQIWCVKHGA